MLGRFVNDTNSDIFRETPIKRYLNLSSQKVLLVARHRGVADIFATSHTLSETQRHCD